MTTRGAAYPKGFTLPGGTPSDDLLNKLQTAGCKVVRVGNPEIQDMLSSPSNGSNAGTFSTSALTTLGGRIMSRGMDFHYSQLGVPVQVNAAAGTGGNWKYHAKTSGARTQMAGYATAVGNALKALMTAHPGRTAYYEVNQEPNIRQFNPPDSPPDATMAQMGLEAAACYAAVRATAPLIKLVGPSFAVRGGIVHTDSTDIGQTSPSALHAMVLGAPALAAGLLDFQGHHPYTGASNPADLTNEYYTGQTIAFIFECQVTSAMTKAGGGLLPVCFTEFGINRVTLGENVQATNLTRQLQVFQDLRDSGNVAGPEEYYTFASGDDKSIFRSTGVPYGAGVIWQYDAAQDITVSTPPPVAAFTVSPPWAQNAGSAVAFHDTSTHTPTSWHWTFGDGGTSTSQNPSHTYSAAGLYTVTLTATNANGSDAQTVSYPIADVSVDPLPGSPSDAPVVLIELGIPSNSITDADTWVVDDHSVRSTTNSSWTVAEQFHWYEIQDDLVDYHISRGRDNSLDRVKVGTATVTVRNDNAATAAEYDSQNWNSRYFPSLLSGKARLRITIDGAGVFTGIISDAPTTDEIGNVVTTTFQAVDFLSLLNVPIKYRPEAVHSAGTRIYRIGERAGVWSGGGNVVFASNQGLPRFLFTGVLTYAKDHLFEDTALSLAMDVAHAEQGMLYAASAPAPSSPGGSINFIDRNHMSSASAPLFTLTDGEPNATSVIQYAAITRNDGKDLVRNRIKFRTVDGEDISAYDAASERVFGPGEETFDSPIGSTTPALTRYMNQVRCNILRADYKDASLRFTVLVEAHRYSSTQRRSYISGQEIGHVCRVIRTPPGGGYYLPGGTALNRVQVIDGIRIDGSPGICNVEFTMSNQLAA